MSYNTISPRNKQIRQVAKRSIESLAQAAKEQYTNAIYADGVKSNLYIRKEFGTPCSCRADGLSILSEDGDMDYATLDSLTSGSEVLIKNSGMRSNFNDAEVEAHKPIGEQFDIGLDTETSEPLVTADNRTLPAGNNACGVCFGTGIIGGFNVHQGYREVLTVPNSECNLFYVDTTSTHTFVAEDRGASVKWQILLPAYLTGINSYRVFNNKEIVDPYMYNLKIDNNITLFDACDGRKHDIELTTSINNFRFTHIEIQLDLYKEPLYVSVPKYDRDVLEDAIFEGLMSNSIVVPPTVPKVTRGSVVRENLYDKCWLVTTVYDWVDHIKNIHGWELGCRVIQDYETFNILPSLQSKRTIVQSAPRDIGRINRYKFL